MTIVLSREQLNQCLKNLLILIINQQHKRGRHPVKILILLISISIISISAFGQTAVQKPAPSSDVTIIQKRWSSAQGKSVPIRAIDTTDDPQKDARAVIENQKENEVRARAGQPALPPPTAPQREKNYLPGIESYLYETKIRNNSDKIIKEVVWEYVFSDPLTKQELGRRQFTNKETIRPNKEKRLTGRSSFPPTGTVSVTTAAGKKIADQYAEDIKIVSITYADGSRKQAAAN